jgi:hypothetical protein
MIVNDSGYQLLFASLLIITITLARLLHTIPNYWGAMFSIYVFFGGVIVEVFNYYIPLSSWHINEFVASAIALIISSVVVYTVYSYFVSGSVVLGIIAVIIMVCYMGQDGVNWFNSWLPHGMAINLTVFVILVLLLGLLAWLLYEWAMEWDFLQYLIMTLLIIFACSLAMDVFYELIVAQPDAIDVLDFNLTYLILVILTTLLYFGIEYLGNRYLPPPPKYCCCVCCRSKSKKKTKETHSTQEYQAIPLSPSLPPPLPSSPLSDECYYEGEDTTLLDLSTSYTNQPMNPQDVYDLLSMPKSTLLSRWSGSGSGNGDTGG